MKKLLTITAFALSAMFAFAQRQVGIDKIVPSVEQLGGFCQSNRLVVLLDPLSSPTIVTNEGAGWLKLAQNVVGKNGREAYGDLRCFHEGHSHLVWINRFKSKGDIPADWGTDKQTKSRKLPSIGEEARFYQRDGMHNNVAFRRGPFLIDVEGSTMELEPLIKLAEAIDLNIVKQSKTPR